MLSSFIQQFNTQLHQESSALLNFSSFDNSVMDVIKNSIVPILKNCIYYKFLNSTTNTRY